MCLFLFQIIINFSDMAFLKRLRLHYAELKKDPPPLCHAEPDDPEKDLTHWIGYIDGPEHTPFAAHGKIFRRKSRLTPMKRIAVLNG